MWVYLPYDDYSAMQWPCPSGFHVPLNSEWVAVKTIWTALWGWSSDWTNFGIALKLPFAGYRRNSTAAVRGQGSTGQYWSSSIKGYNSSSLYFFSTSLSDDVETTRASGNSVRCFRDSPKMPTSSRTKLYWTSIEAGWIFWSSADWLISLSSDGNNWITIQDKNLWATQVWNSWDTLSEDNCGKYYQRWNNYWFPRTWSVTTSSTQVDASAYWPWNYYSSSTFITNSSKWDSTDNGNLWWWVTGVNPMSELKNAYIGEYRVPWSNTYAYYKFEQDANDYSGNGRNATAYNITYTTLTSWKKIWVFNGSSSYAVCPFYNYTWTTNPTFTICVRIRLTAVPGSSALRNLINNQTSDYNGYFTDLLWAKLRNCFGNSIAEQSYTNMTAWSWYLLCVTVSNWAINRYLYYNWTLYTWSESWWTYTSVNQYVNIGRRATWDRYWYGNISELIIENKVRTTQEVAKYYNLTKSNYWL